MTRMKESSSPKVGEPRTTRSLPTHEEIALRAYHIYLERGGAPGNELEDWTRAERELLEKYGKTRHKVTPIPTAA